MVHLFEKCIVKLPFQHLVRKLSILLKEFGAVLAPLSIAFAVLRVLVFSLRNCIVKLPFQNMHPVRKVHILKKEFGAVLAHLATAMLTTQH